MAGFVVFVGFELQKHDARPQLALFADDPWLAKLAAYQRKAEATPWRWSKERVSLDYCVKHNLRGYTARSTPLDDGSTGALQIAVCAGTEEVATFHGHGLTVFVQADDVLYLAYYHPMIYGGSIVAYDLKARKQLWTCALRGNPPFVARHYNNRLILEVDGDAILVFGSESHGRYIEYVDRQSGQTVGHKKLPPDPTTFE
jgi:hypothetical protein